MRQSSRRATTATPADALGRGGRGRVAPAQGGLRAIHHTGGPVTVTVQADGQTATWQPPAAVVLSGRHASRGGDARGAVRAIHAADVSCGYVNFFTSASSAAAWARAHPEATGEILDQPAALRLGTAVFGPLLADDR